MIVPRSLWYEIHPDRLCWGVPQVPRGVEEVTRVSH